MKERNSKERVQKQMKNERQRDRRKEKKTQRDRRKHLQQLSGRCTVNNVSLSAS